jgi:enoyl-[acyl-carrier-protein] reductase (NADH)
MKLRASILEPSKVLRRILVGASAAVLVSDAAHSISGDIAHLDDDYQDACAGGSE